MNIKANGRDEKMREKCNIKVENEWENGEIAIELPIEKGTSKQLEETGKCERNWNKLKCEWENWEKMQ